MAGFLDAVLTFPTVVFTVMVGFFLLYALATLLGALDIEWLDGLLGIDDTPDSGLESVLDFLGATGIPITVFGGVSATFAWIGSIAATKFLPDSLAFGLATLVGASAAGVALGALAVRPFRRLFATAPAASRKHIVGKICTVRSLHVDETSGTADVEDGGAGFVAEVRCFRENQLTLGSKAIVYDYDANTGFYHVGPIDPSIAEVDFTSSTTTARHTETA